MKTPPSARGSALVLAMIIILVLSIIAIAVVRLGTNETAAAAAGAKRSALQQCAQAATAMLLSQFHVQGVRASDIVALNVPLDGPGGQTFARGGHIDTMDVTLGQVTYLPPTSFGPTLAMNNLTNVLRPVGMGGLPLKVVVHCQSGSGQLEVELGVRFGL